MVEVVKKEVEVTKEVSEVFAAIALLIEDIKAKKEAAVIFGENFQSLMAAIQGFEMMGEEVKHEAVYMTAAVGAAEITKVLLKKEEVVA